MIEALLRGKLSMKQENMEDILTSNVFGTLQYVSPELGLFRFLAAAKTMEGETPFDTLMEAGAFVEYEFWPRWQKCEPDVQLLIHGSDSCSYVVGIEAKYHSGKSTEAGPSEEETEEQREAECTDQLIREWVALVDEAAIRNAKPILIYLTADLGFPAEQIRDSLAEYHRKRPALPTPTICWLSWRELPRLFQNNRNSQLARLGEMAERMGLFFFHGISFESGIHADWVFLVRWDHKMPAVTCQWRFTQ